jgi:5-methylcytosine-specific restriction endonuclease McrA
MIQQFTLDHVMPRSRGGKTDWGNIVAACDSCNQKKKARTPVEAEMNLLTKPEAPQVLPVVNDSNDPNRLRAIPEVWKAYLAS